MPTKARTTEETYRLAELPEFLRSPAVGKLIAVGLDRLALLTREADQGEAGALTDALAAQLEQAAGEIDAWHTPKPKPDHMNGGS